MDKIDNILNRIIDLIFRNMSEKNKKSIVQFVKFGFVGLSNTLLGYIIYIITIFSLKPLHFPYDYIIGNIVSFILSVLWSFIWNSRFVFTVEVGQKRNPILALLKTYLSYAFTGLFLNNILSFVWVDVLGVPKVIAPLINLFITVPLNFVINKFWAFRTHKAKEKCDDNIKS